MTGSRKRRHSKWDDEDSEVLPEKFYDRTQTRRPREPLSPSRGSRRHDNRSKESTVSWHREGNSSRISPGLDEWRPPFSSRSPRNGWSRPHRISRSRSRSRSQSPGHNFKRESTSRSRSGAPAQICRDFTVGRCRRGNSCHFFHQDKMCDVRRVECNSPDDWETRSRRTGGSRYSPDDSKNCIIRTEKSAQICNEFIKGRCRRGDLCRYMHDESAAADVFEKEPVDDRYRNRDHDLQGRDHDRSMESRDTYRDLDHRRRDTYPDRNNEYEPPKRNETLCKFFAAGNCRNGTRCKFSHQVQEILSPDRRSRGDRPSPDHKTESGQAWDDRRWSDATTQGWGEDKNETKEMNTVRRIGGKKGPDHEYEGDRVWDGLSWSDGITVSNVPVVLGWGDDKNDTTEVVKDVTGARPGDDAWSRDMFDIKQAQDTTVTACKPQKQNEMQPLLWKIESNIPVVHGWGDDKNEITEVTNDVTQTRPRDDCWSHDMLDIKQTQDTTVTICKPQIQDTMQPLPPQWKIENNVPVVHDWRDDKNHITEVIKDVNRPRTGDDCCSHDMLDINQTQDRTVNACKPQIQDKMQPLQWKVENNFPGMGLSAPRNIGNKAADMSHVVSLPSPAIAPDSANAHSTVSNEQLAQLSHLTASLTQLLESRQQFSHISSAVTPHGLPNLPEIVVPVPPVSTAILQPNEAPEVSKPYDPLCHIIEPKMPYLGNHLLPSVGQKISNNNHRANHEIHLEGGNVNQQEPFASSTEEKITAEGTTKAPENGPSRDVDVDDGAEDVKKLKDTKGLRPFKFALAELVKELLKPSWKDGQVSKDAYKTIVKKVVEKVTDTLGPQIPQTKEKIDLYLSCSKPKIDKLVQAYVGKHKS